MSDTFLLRGYPATKFSYPSPLDMTNHELQIRAAVAADLAVLDAIRIDAFAPIFRSFRDILGEPVYTLAQSHEDAAQSELLNDLFADHSEWSVFVAESNGTVVGFVSVKCDDERKVGEIGLNAVAPGYANQGIGTRLYQFACEQMKKMGMKVATVATGGDPSHRPAVAAYRKAGFDVEIPSIWLCREL